MDLWRTIKNRLHKAPVFAALCTASADGSNLKYAVSQKHALLVMVRSQTSSIDDTIHRLLGSNGWKDPEIRNVKILDRPFVHEDPAIHDCYQGAVTRDGGIIVYSDPIMDA